MSKPEVGRVNSSVRWWGRQRRNDKVYPPTYPDGVSCDSEVYRVDTYKIKCDDEDTD